LRERIFGFSKRVESDVREYAVELWVEIAKKVRKRFGREMYDSEEEFVN